VQKVLCIDDVALVLGKFVIDKKDECEKFLEMVLVYLGNYER
jgi:hypothetical protein